MVYLAVWEPKFPIGGVVPWAKHLHVVHTKGKCDHLRVSCYLPLSPRPAPSSQLKGPHIDHHYQDLQHPK